MKKLLTLLCILLVASCSPLPNPKEKKSPQTVPHVPLEFEAILLAPGLSRSEIISRVNKWVVKSYVDYKAVIQYKDSTFLAINARSGNYTYQFTAEAKPGKCKLNFDRFQEEDEFREKIDIPTKEVAVKNLMYRGDPLEVRNREQERINRFYSEINGNSSMIISLIASLLENPIYHDW